MNYIGSKLRIIDFITDTILETIDGDLKDKIFCDMFAGVGIVGKHFKPLVKSVISNDMEHYSYVLNSHYLSNVPAKYYDGVKKCITMLNNMKPTPGFIFEHYSRGGGNGRLYFTDSNAMRIDTITQYIDVIMSLPVEASSNACLCTPYATSDNKYDIQHIYYYLMTCLLEAADKVANTASVYGAFLKDYKRQALTPLVIKEIDIVRGNANNKVFCKDANELINEIEGDILYLDPPYNSRQYGANYHILNTIVLNDDFEPKGKTGMRDYEKSAWCSKTKVNDVFEDLIKKANFKYIFLSYNNEGLMSCDTIKKIMSKYGAYSVAKKENIKRFKTTHTENKFTTEYLHILKKY